MKGNLLIIDDDRTFCGLLKRHFEEEYAVTAFSDPEEAVGFIGGNRMDVVLTDLSMPKIDGMGILQAVKEKSQGTDVIVMTAYARVETAVEAMKNGAYDYIVKPVSLDELSLHMKKLFEKRRLVEENINLRKFVDLKYRPENVIGESSAMEEVRRFIARVSRTDATVLITGESGTGKHLVARTIHFSGKRKDRGFISVHCGAIPQGLLDVELFGGDGGSMSSVSGQRERAHEEAGGGTLVLSEIGDMDISIQAKLLAVLENRTMKRMGPAEEAQTDVMVIATTNKDLDRLQREGRFRSDLFYRLGMFNLRIPPLRERKEDIPSLAMHFFSQYKAEFEKPSMQIGPEALEALQNYDWPGNVRELKSLFAKLCLLEDSEIITTKHVIQYLPKAAGHVTSLVESGESLTEIEKNLIRETLKRAKGNMATAAKMLNISYDTLRYRMKKFGIRQRPYKL